MNHSRLKLEEMTRTELLTATKSLLRKYPDGRRLLKPSNEPADRLLRRARREMASGGSSARWAKKARRLAKEGQSQLALDLSLAVIQETWFFFRCFQPDNYEEGLLIAASGLMNSADAGVGDRQTILAHLFKLLEVDVTGREKLTHCIIAWVPHLRAPELKQWLANVESQLSLAGAPYPSVRWAGRERWGRIGLALTVDPKAHSRFMLRHQVGEGFDSKWDDARINRLVGLLEKVVARTARPTKLGFSAFEWREHEYFQRQSLHPKWCRELLQLARASTDPGVVRQAMRGPQ